MWVNGGVHIREMFNCHLLTISKRKYIIDVNISCVR